MQHGSIVSKQLVMSSWCLALGVLYVAAIAAIILIPTVGLVKMLKKIKSHELQKHTILTKSGYKQCGDLFTSVLKNLQDANCKEYLLTLADNLSNAYIMAGVTKRYLRKLQDAELHSLWCEYLNKKQ